MKLWFEYRFEPCMQMTRCLTRSRRLMCFFLFSDIMYVIVLYEFYVYIKSLIKGCVTRTNIFYVRFEMYQFYGSFHRSSKLIFSFYSLHVFNYSIVDYRKHRYALLNICLVSHDVAHLISISGGYKNGPII